MKTVELRAIKESTRDFEALEARIKALFVEHLFLPLVHALDLPRETIENARPSPLEQALIDGYLRLEGEVITGTFNPVLAKALRAQGFRYSAKLGGYVGTISPEVEKAAAQGEKKFRKQAQQLNDTIDNISPAEIAGKLDAAGLFDSTLWKVDRELNATLKPVGLKAGLPSEQRRRIAQEWQENLALWVNDFTAEEIKRLRGEVQASVLKGSRRPDLEKLIKKSFSVTANKAKFLARQETGLLMAKFKETRYAAAGVTEYKWRCVAGSKLHPVRPSHKILEGKTFSWNSPPITTAPGEPARRNNPGQDYNCRCFARPIVKFTGVSTE